MLGPLVLSAPGGRALTVLPALSTTLPCCAVLHWLQISHLAAQHYHRAGRRSWETGCRRRGRRGPVFGDADGPRSSSNCAVAAGGVLGRAALAASGGFTGVKRAQSLGFVGLTLPVQQFVQDLREKNTIYQLCGEMIHQKLKSHMELRFILVPAIVLQLHWSPHPSIQGPTGQSTNRGQDVVEAGYRELLV